MDQVTVPRATVEQEPVAWSDARLRGIASDYFPEAKDWPAAMLCLRHLLMEQAKYPPASARVPLTVTELQQALVDTDLVDPDAIDDPDGFDNGFTLQQIDALHRRLMQTTPPTTTTQPEPK